MGEGPAYQRHPAYPQGAQQWVVTFQNNAIRNVLQRRLYVIMRLDGTFVSANHRLNCAASPMGGAEQCLPDNTRCSSGDEDACFLAPARARVVTRGIR
jgi:hypothetical protein